MKEMGGNPGPSLLDLEIDERVQMFGLREDKKEEEENEKGPVIKEGSLNPDPTHFPNEAGVRIPRFKSPISKR
jgi:hypothetical protein